MNDNINRPIDAQKPARPAISGSERSSKAERRGIVRIIGAVDRPFLLIIIALLCIGSVMVFSASYAYAKTYFNDSYYFARKQIEWAVLGLVAMCAVILVDYRLIKRFAWLGYGFALLLNAAVVVMGIANNGAQRWIKIGSLQFQPSELLKFFIIIVCASYISNNQSRMKSFKYGVLPFILILAPAAGLLVLQSHLSATIIVTALVFCMMFVGGGNLAWLGGAVGAGAAAVFAVLNLPFIRDIPFIQEKLPHIFNRLDIWADPVGMLSNPETRDAAWQPAQSLFAISSGGFWGLGIGKSNQKHGFLPEPQNDYVFAILCEELGFFGAVGVILLFFAFAYRGFRIASRCPNRFCSLVVMGLTLKVSIQAMLNIAVVSNVLPSTGISLPFFSYGGTALIMLMGEMGIILSMSRYSYMERG